VEQLLPFLVFGAFLAYFAWRARREGMSARQWVDAQNREVFSRPGWWKPAAILPAAFCVIALIMGISEAGFQWWYLLIPVIVFGMFAVWAYAVTHWARR
jgi:hypothetical protein